MIKLSELVEYVRAGTKNLLLGANVGSLRFLASPVKAYRYWNACLFLRDSLGGRSLPEMRVQDAFPDFPSDPELRFPALSQSWAWADPSYLADLVHLALLCKARRPRRIFEIGTSSGYTSLLMAANSPPQARAWTLDLPTAASDAVKLPLTLMDKKIVTECHQKEPCFVAYAGGYAIERLYGDSATFDFSAYRGSIDLFFIDGAHTYEYVKSDTINALRCCRRGSVIVWHDYGRPGLSYGVTKWLNEFSKTARVYCTPGSSVAFLYCCGEPSEILRETRFHDHNLTQDHAA
jgi:hypothetical protein